MAFAMLHSTADTILTLLLLSIMALLGAAQMSRCNNQDASKGLISSLRLSSHRNHCSQS